jgi:peptidoglycan hydrolase-like protein with peptidoglycan-binding domain
MSIPGIKGAKAVQRALKQLGLYNGPIDGDVGPLTRRALEEIARRHNITNDDPGGTAVISVLATDISERIYP